MIHRVPAATTLALAAVALLAACPYHHIVKAGRWEEPKRPEAPMGPKFPADLRVVDLTHPLAADVPVFPGDPRPEFKPHANIEANGYYSRTLSLSEHNGTHVDAPAHFVTGGASVDQIPASSLVREGVLIDVAQRCLADPDYRLSRDDVLAWEAANGPVPEGAIVLLRTGWDTRWYDELSYRGEDEAGGLHFPGYGEDAAVYLLKQRACSALGVDTLSTDHGPSVNHPVHLVTHELGRYQIENLANLAGLPARGFVVVVAPLPLREGSGAPARVFALVSVAR